MKIVAPIIEIAGRKYCFVEKHREADAILAQEGIAIPSFPSGCNTVIANVKVTGRPALLINQKGFKPEASDNEEEVNGCMLLILMDATGEDRIDFGLLETALKIIEKT